MTAKSKIHARSKGEAPKKFRQVRAPQDQSRNRAVRAQKTPARDLAPSVRAGTKMASMIAMLRRSGGASIEALAKATGWQVHSVRGAISGTLKKKLGLVVVSDKTGAVRLYRIDGDAAA
jgi:Protein of unknown function (DUF3489)